MSGSTHVEVGRAVILAVLLAVVFVATPTSALAGSGADTFAGQANASATETPSANSTATQTPSVQELATEAKTERAAARRATNLGTVPVAALGAGTGLGIGLLLGTLAVYVGGDE